MRSKPRAVSINLQVTAVEAWEREAQLQGITIDEWVYATCEREASELRLARSIANYRELAAESSTVRTIFDPAF